MCKSCNTSPAHASEASLENNASIVRESCQVDGVKSPSIPSIRRKMRITIGELIGGRIAKCGSWLPETGEVQVIKNETGSFYSGCETCGSVWACPCCAPKIINKRAKEVSQACSLARELGHDVVMVTLTMRHKRSDRLEELMKIQKEVFRKFKRTTRFTKKIKKEFGLVGYINASEITNGKLNGWHPHFHMLLFVDPVEDRLEELGNRFFSIWSDYLEKADRKALKSAFDIKRIKNEDDEAEYIQKWQISDEITSNGLGKKGKRKGRNPWEILHAITTMTSSDIELDKNLMKEYYHATKGKKQLVWSPGLKEYFAIGEKTDEEIANEKVEGELVARVQGELYTWIRKKGFAPEFLAWLDHSPAFALHNLRTVGFTCKLDGINFSLYKQKAKSDGNLRLANLQP